jgi:hypothetical protein
MGNIGGVLGPYLMGWFKQLTTSYAAGLGVTAAVLILGALLASTIKPLHAPYGRRLSPANCH